MSNVTGVQAARSRLSPMLDELEVIHSTACHRRKLAGGFTDFNLQHVEINQASIVCDAGLPTYVHPLAPAGNADVGCGTGWAEMQGAALGVRVAGPMGGVARLTAARAGRHRMCHENI